MTIPVNTLGADATTATAAAATTQTTQTSGTSATGGASATGGTSGKDGFGLDKDAFLKILVEQLRHQDPSSPGDSEQYIQQMTQYSMLEQLTNISEATQGQTAATAGNTAIGLVGRTVTYVGDDAQSKSGVVDGVKFTSDGPSLTVAGHAGVTLASVTEVR